MNFKSFPEKLERLPSRAVVARRIAGFWRRHGWLIIRAAWVVALVLGLIGFAMDAPPGSRPTDIAYRTLQLIAMNSGDVKDASLPLDVARFLIPILAALTAITALLSLFRDRWQEFLLRGWHNHIVICGLSRKGWLLVQRFAERGERVVVIEADESHDLIRPCRERGAVVLIGDATDADTLNRAGATHAHHVVAVTDDDGINAEISVRCAGLLRAVGRKDPGPLGCTVHLVDPELFELARSREIALEENIPLRLELFNVFNRGGRLMWSKYGPARDAGVAGTGAGRDGCAAHVVVVGLGRLGESLIITAGREWYARMYESACGGLGRLRVTVVDVGAAPKCQALYLRHPRLADACDLVPYTLDVNGPEFYGGRFLDREPSASGTERDGPPASAVFVCFDNDTLGLRTSLAIRQMLLTRGAPETPVVVRMAEASGLARLVDPDGDGEPVTPFASLRVFPLLDRTCTPEAVLGTSFREVVGQAIHERYRRNQAGIKPPDDPAMRPWNDLSEALRESNRVQADGIELVLGSIGCTTHLAEGSKPARVVFSKDEIERMAELTHRQWVNARIQAGWANGPRNPDHKITPYLAPYAEIADDVREWDRQAVRAIPDVLAAAGYEVRRSR
jgi:voltage-gated potassium channel Kch